MTRHPCRTPACTGTALNRPTCARCRTRVVETALTPTTPAAGTDTASARDVAARLTALNLSDTDIARILGVTLRTLRRWQAQHRNSIH